MLCALAGVGAWNTDFGCTTIGCAAGYVLNWMVCTAACWTVVLWTDLVLTSHCPLNLRFESAFITLESLMEVHGNGLSGQALA